MLRFGRVRYLRHLGLSRLNQNLPVNEPTSTRLWCESRSWLLQLPQGHRANQTNPLVNPPASPFEGKDLVTSASRKMLLHITAGKPRRASPDATRYGSAILFSAPHIG
jgi:hypothetical protein